MKKTEKERFRCPHCGSDEFLMNVNSVNTVRIVPDEHSPYYADEVISTDGECGEICCRECFRDWKSEDLEEFALDYRRKKRREKAKRKPR